MYAVGAADIDNVLMILAASLDMEPPMRDIVTREMVRGFNDLCTIAGTKVRSAQRRALGTSLRGRPLAH
jgi:hypothetical protein